MTLYEMSDAARQLQELFEAGEIDEQTVIDTMESIGASEKLESYVYVQKNLEAELAAVSSELDRLEKRWNSLVKHINRLKKAQVEFMQVTGQNKANVGTFKLRLTESKSCEITDESLIPMEYMIEIPASVRPDKKQMLKDMKNGKSIEGASLKTSYSVTSK